MVECDNSALVSVALPAEFTKQSTEFIAELEKITVEPDRPARVVVNERTGTIVLGKDVRIAPVAVLHGNLSVVIQTTFNVSQPSPFSSTGTTEVIPQTSVNVKDEKARNVVLKQGATVEELVKALSAIGSTTRDVIAILENLRVKALCVAPTRGMEEGTQADVPAQEFGLVVGEPTRFRFFASSLRREDKAGEMFDDIVSNDEFEELAPTIETTLPADGQETGKLVPVNLQAAVNEN